MSSELPITIAFPMHGIGCIPGCFPLPLSCALPSLSESGMRMAPDGVRDAAAAAGSSSFVCDSSPGDGVAFPKLGEGGASERVVRCVRWGLEY